MPKRKALSPIEVLRLRYAARKAGKDPDVAVVQRLQETMPKPKRERQATVEKRVEKQKQEQTPPPEVPKHLDRYSAVCYVCRRVGLKSQMVVLPRNDNDIMEGNDNLYRHFECEAGSPNWMASEIGKKSKYYRYFLPSKRRAIDDCSGSEDRKNQAGVRGNKRVALPSLRPPRGVR